MIFDHKIRFHSFLMPGHLDPPLEEEPEPAPLTLEQIRELSKACDIASKHDGEVAMDFGPVMKRLLEIVDEKERFLANVREDRNRLVRGDLDPASFRELAQVRKERNELKQSISVLNERHCKEMSERDLVLRDVVTQRDVLKRERDALKKRLLGEPWPFNMMAERFGPELKATKAELAEAQDKLKNVRKELGKANKKLQSQSAEIKRLTENAHERDCKINRMYAERNELRQQLAVERMVKGGHTALECPQGSFVKDCEDDKATITFACRGEMVNLHLVDKYSKHSVSWLGDAEAARKLGRLLLGAADTAEGI